ncbi:MAG: hypothetical protein PHV63_04170 [Candidatus Daviesbacteria bacterium]|nr:hypothetical protein [Candidatus Daviesbacteria bacterium]
MKHSVHIRLRVEKNVVTRVVRILKGKGSLTVKAGQQVTPDEIIGSGTIASGFRVLNLSTLLSVPAGEVEKYLTRQLGQRIYKGELLAFKKGWLLFGRKVVTSPADGVLDFLNTKTGELKIAFLSKKADLPAGVFGFVEDVDTERGQVIIRTLVSKIYGMFGSGRSRDGILHILGKKDSLVSKEEIQTKYDGQILTGGSLFFKDAISVCISQGVSGIITGGINAEDYKGMAGGRLVFPKKLDNDIGIGVVVCEGFGSIPIGDDIFEVLSEYEGKFVFIDGNKALISLPSFSSASLTKIKNTKLPPLLDHKLRESGGYSMEAQELKVGLKVRIVGNSCLGEQGKIVSRDDSLTLLPSGVKDYLVTVETTRRKLQVPVANLEIIG